MSGQRCPNCGGYEWHGGVCKHCGYIPKTSTPSFELRKVDIFELAEGLKKKGGQERRQAIPRLSTCPYCHENSLFYDSINDRFGCLNINTCPKYNHLILSNSPEYKSIILNLNTNINKGESTQK